MACPSEKLVVVVVLAVHVQRNAASSPRLVLLPPVVSEVHYHISKVLPGRRFR